MSIRQFDCTCVKQSRSLFTAISNAIYGGSHVHTQLTLLDHRLKKSVPNLATNSVGVLQGVCEGSAGFCTKNSANSANIVQHQY